MLLALKSDTIDGRSYHENRESFTSPDLLFAAHTKKMDCRVKPGNDGGETVVAILRPFERDPL
jgi:hypothetical protein